MDVKKEKRVNVKIANLVTISMLLVLFGILFLIYYLDIKPEKSITAEEGITSITTTYRNTNKKLPKKSNVEYEIIDENINLGRYNYNGDNVYVHVKSDNLLITSKEELLNHIAECVTIYEDNEDKEFLTSDIYLENLDVLKQFDNKFFDEKNLIVMLSNSKTGIVKNISSIVKKDEKVSVNCLFEYYRNGYQLAILASPQIEFISVDKSVNEVEFNMYYEEIIDNHGLRIMIISSTIISISVIILENMIISKYNNRKENKSHKILKNIIFGILIFVFIGVIIFSSLVFAEAMFWEDVYATIDKPIIYLYPTEETNVNVKLGYKEDITVSYPKYVDGWNVIAKENGDLVDTKTNRNLYALYYESIDKNEYKIEDEGFVVKGEDTIEFLEEKLAILGLNEREAEEFIVYWLPKLEANKYNYIRFATNEEIEANMPLTIEPNPDTVIRVLMTFKGLKRKIDVKEQELITPERRGFTVIEWGGTKIN